MSLDIKQLSVRQPVWLLRGEHIAPFLVSSLEKDFIVLETLEIPRRLMPFELRIHGNLYGSEKDARIALIKEFEEDLEIRGKRLSAARSALKQHLRTLEGSETELKV
jgi:hypothetical protein